jgi:hypothetical protein
MFNIFIDIKFLIGLITLFFIVLFYMFIEIKHYFKYKNCKHDKVHETRACDAICINCGKNLGFIGAWYEEKRTKDLKELKELGND